MPPGDYGSSPGRNPLSYSNTTQTSPYQTVPMSPYQTKPNTSYQTASPYQTTRPIPQSPYQTTPNRMMPSPYSMTPSMLSPQHLQSGEVYTTPTHTAQPLTVPAVVPSLPSKPQDNQVYSLC